MSFSVHQRKTSLPEEERNKVIEMFKNGHSPALIKQSVTCSLSKIRQILRVEGLTNSKYVKNNNFWPRF